MFSTFALSVVLALSPQAAPSPSLLETKWTLVEVAGKPVPALPRAPTLVFDTNLGEAHGHTGCNGYGSPYRLSDTRHIRFGTMVSTQMLCAEGMDVERALTHALEDTRSYAISDDSLILRTASGTTTARFSPAP